MCIFFTLLSRHSLQLISCAFSILYTVGFFISISKYDHSMFDLERKRNAVFGKTINILIVPCKSFPRSPVIEFRTSFACNFDKSVHCFYLGFNNLCISRTIMFSSEFILREWKKEYLYSRRQRSCTLPGECCRNFACLLMFAFQRTESFVSTKREKLSFQAEQFQRTEFIFSTSVMDKLRFFAITNWQLALSHFEMNASVSYICVIERIEPVYKRSQSNSFGITSRMCRGQRRKGNYATQTGYSQMQSLSS